MIRRAIGLVSLAAMLWTLPVASAIAQFDSKPAAGQAAAGSLGKSETHKWEYGIIVTAAGGPCAGLSGTVPIPQDWPEQQVKVIGEEISPAVRRHSYRTIEGLKQLVFEIPQLPAGEKATCLITLEITRSEQQKPSDTASFVMAKEMPRDIKKYLGASPFIESANSKFRSLAKELTEGKEEAWDQVEAIYDGVRERVKFEVSSKEKFKGAVGALRDGEADKEDLTSLFVGLCRAHKVPARMVWSMDSCHAEFYLKNASGEGTWIPCQVHGAKQFGSISDFRPILEKGDNFKVPEKKEAQRFVSEFLTGKGGGGKPQVEFRRRLAD
jgi:hypothetical protein